jgi:hypothetical protein
MHNGKIKRNIFIMLTSSRFDKGHKYMKSYQCTLALLSLVTIPAHALDLSPEYLYGEWCFESFKVGNDSTPENVNRVFEKDGKLLEQQSAYNKTLKHRGFWDIKDGKLRIKPVLSSYNSVEIVSNDKFIISWMGGGMHYVRGKCK